MGFDWSSRQCHALSMRWQASDCDSCLDNLPVLRVQQAGHRSSLQSEVWASVQPQTRRRTIYSTTAPRPSLLPWPGLIATAARHYSILWANALSSRYLACSLFLLPHPSNIRDSRFVICGAVLRHVIAGFFCVLAGTGHS